MQLTSFEFLIFLPIVVLINFIIPRKYKYIWLFLTSLCFYASIDLTSTGILDLIILGTFFAGIAMNKFKNQKGAKKAILAISVAALVGFLLYIRYFEYMASRMKEMGESATLLLFSTVGISFYTLKAISYLVDIYRGDLVAEKNIIKYALYVSFFPQITAGPIERAKSLLPQFAYPVSVDFDRLRDGLLQMLWGYFLKMVLADRLKIFVDSAYKSYGNAPGTIMFIGFLFYTFEIYCDFGGYSHMAIGIARILGIDSMNNFESPYLAQSIPEFWRRWHISLSSFLKDYVYIPLGGNRKGKVRKYLNILIVFAVSGIWHGAGLTFIVWGLLHGVYQVVGYVLKPVRDKLVDVLKVNRNAFSHRLFKTAFTFMLVNYAWVYFRSINMYWANEYILQSFQFTPWIFTDGSLFKYGLDQANMLVLVLGLILLVVVDIFNYKGVVIREKILSQGIWLRWAIAIIGIIVILVFGIWGPGYNASSFIYQQF